MARKEGSVTTPPDASRMTAAGIGRSQRAIWRWGFTPCPERLSIVRDWPAFGVWGNAPASNRVAQHGLFLRLGGARHQAQRKCTEVKRREDSAKPNPKGAQASARSTGGGLVSFAAKIAKNTKTLRTMRSLRLTIFHCQSNRFTQVVITHQKLKA